MIEWISGLQRILKLIEPKKMRALDHNLFYVKQLHYGIKKDTPLKQENLMAIILYCDFNDLSTKFSATFRAIYPYEGIASIKARNSQFWHLSKILRETVQCFGKIGNKGPFFLWNVVYENT